MSVPSSRVEHDTANLPQTQLVYLCPLEAFDETDFPNENPMNITVIQLFGENESNVDGGRVLTTNSLARPFASASC